MWGNTMLSFACRWTGLLWLFVLCPPAAQREQTFCMLLFGRRKGSWAVKLSKTSSVLLCWFWNSLVSNYLLFKNVKKKTKEKDGGKHNGKSLLFTTETWLQTYNAPPFQQWNELEDPTQIPQFLQVLTKWGSTILKSRTTLSGILTYFNSISGCDRQRNVSLPVFCPSSENSGVHKYVFWAQYELQNCCATPSIQHSATWKTSVQVSWSSSPFLKVRLCNLGDGGQVSGRMKLLCCPPALHSLSSLFPTILSQLGGYCPTLAIYSR